MNAHLIELSSEVRTVATTMKDRKIVNTKITARVQVERDVIMEIELRKEAIDKIIDIVRRETNASMGNLSAWTVEPDPSCR